MAEHITLYISFDSLIILVFLNKRFGKNLLGLPLWSTKCK